MVDERSELDLLTSTDRDRPWTPTHVLRLWRGDRDLTDDEWTVPVMLGAPDGPPGWTTPAYTAADWASHRPPSFHRERTGDDGSPFTWGRARDRDGSGDGTTSVIGVVPCTPYLAGFSNEQGRRHVLLVNESVRPLGPEMAWPEHTAHSDVMAAWVRDLEAQITGVRDPRVLPMHAVEAFVSRLGDSWVIPAGEIARMREGEPPVVSTIPDAERWADELAEAADSDSGCAGSAVDAARFIAHEDRLLSLALLEPSVPWLLPPRDTPQVTHDLTAPGASEIADAVREIVDSDRPPFHATHEWRYSMVTLDGTTHDAVDQVMVVDGLGYSRWQWVDGVQPEWQVDERGLWSSLRTNEPLPFDAYPDPLPTRYTMDAGPDGQLHLVEIDAVGMRDLGAVTPETVAVRLHERVVGRLQPIEATRIELNPLHAACSRALDEWPLWEVTLGEIVAVGRGDIGSFGEGGHWFREYPPLAVESPDAGEGEPYRLPELPELELAPEPGGGGEGGP